MTIKLIQDSYGKSNIRVGKLTRHADYHDFKEIHVNIHLEGDFETVYTQGDNRSVLPTDTMKNTVFALAQDHPLDTIESFGLHLADYFLKNNAQISKIVLDITQIRWEKMNLNGNLEPFTYMGCNSEKWTSHIEQSRKKSAIVASGIADMRILKTTHSGFENYIVDKFTTLPPTADRILATALETVWQYGNLKNMDFNEKRASVRQSLLAAFAAHDSLSVQHTLYAMGEAVLKNVRYVEEISLKMPNLHYIPFNMKPFGRENKNEIFTASGDAFGYITGTLQRKS